MPLIRKQPIAADALLKELQRSKVIAELQKSAPLDVVAVFMALAKVESAFDVQALGDAGTAYGLWQINSRVHAFDKTRIMGELAYQIEIAGRVFGNVDSIVSQGSGHIAQRRRAGETVTYDRARDVPQWYNIGWQFGSGTLLKFLRSSNDLSPDGFIAWRKSIGKPLSVTLNWNNPLVPRGRRQKFAAEYSRVLADAPSFSDEVIGGSVEDVRDAGNKTISGAKDVLNELADAPGNVVRNTGAAVREELGEFFEKLKVPFVIVAVLFGLFVLAFILLATAGERALIRETFKGARS